MARAGFIEGLFGGLDANLRRALKLAFDYVLDGNLKFGHADHQTRAENFGSFYVNSTTHATANTEFSIVHGLGRTPYLAIPVLDLSDTLAQIVPLKVSREPDESRLYFTSASTSAEFSLLVE